MSAEKPDPRRHAYRDDLASEELKGTVDAPRFVAGRLRDVAASSTPLRANPHASAPLETEILFGESVKVFDEREGWSWVQCRLDGYVGYTPSNALADPGATSTHRVIAPATFAYPARDIKSPPLTTFPMNARLAVTDFDGDFAVVEGERFVYARHMIGVAVDCNNLEGELRRGDLVFWKGHVGIMVTGSELLHANAHHMQTVIEPFAAARRRIEETGSGDVLSVKRP